MTSVWCHIQDEPIEGAKVVEHVSHSGAGGIDVFYGVVRETSEGRPVTLLEYSAYGTMAQKEMERIALDIEAELPGVRVAAIHRMGALQVGDVAVVCAASAPHRDEAFRACRMLIDRIKATVPIWKREHGPDGAYWVGWADARCEGAQGESPAHLHTHR